MIVDTSAMMAIILGEPEADRLLRAMGDATVVEMSAATYVECGIVIDRRSAPATRRRFDQLLDALEVQVVALTPEQAVLAREAHRDFGRGSGSPAGLNLGDCFAYALATDRRDALLFKGDDFAATDVAVAAY
ncbi:type II toxin-antitoxin system VapC family toxin [Janibacter indicus]|uniref:Ribonuclease VapC n=1 Tax=Janibacter indicus TaxID=857417 RepID=A0A7L9J4R5_9MICO|nr:MULTISPECIES: type II toxin-antitoxin system VapC family toxin [Janibacter]QNF95376.1 type II toxin-antitoxin system VapC family toxin [Janibacter sp. YB324]QOK23995.1 type II toxin-antitoxin system VapC family toxin [Janibacter indicus]